MTRTLKIVFRAGAVLQINEVQPDVAVNFVRKYREWLANPNVSETACVVGAEDQSAFDLREIVAIVVL